MPDPFQSWKNGRVYCKHLRTFGMADFELVV
jgi:hypothetical protein